MKRDRTLRQRVKVSRSSETCATAPGWSRAIAPSSPNSDNRWNGREVSGASIQDPQAPDARPPRADPHQRRRIRPGASTARQTEPTAVRAVGGVRPTARDEDQHMGG
jgi:hypothetical protein